MLTIPRNIQAKARKATGTQRSRDLIKQLPNSLRVMLVLTPTRLIVLTGVNPRTKRNRNRLNQQVMRNPIRGSFLVTSILNSSSAWQKMIQSEELQL